MLSYNEVHDIVWDRFEKDKTLLYMFADWGEVGELAYFAKESEDYIALEHGRNELKAYRRIINWLIFMESEH